MYRIGTQEIRNLKVRMPGLNHLFQAAKTGAIAEYGEIEKTMSPVAMEKVAAWILKTLRCPPRLRDEGTQPIAPVIHGQDTFTSIPRPIPTSPTPPCSPALTSAFAPRSTSFSSAAAFCVRT